MSVVGNLLRNVPFLKHLNDEEIGFIITNGRHVFMKKGQLVNLKKTRSLNIVIDGIFEIETIAGRDVVCLPPGAFFGYMPFVDSRKKGDVRALMDSSIFVINEEDFYRLFLKSFKALRGYLKIIENLSLDISIAGSKYFSVRGKVITVFSSSAGTGKTTLASLLGLALRGEKTIILDLSYRGTSVAEYIGQKETTPLSEKNQPAVSTESIIRDRTVKINDSLYLLNVTHASRIKIDPQIIGPALFILARDYRYIVVDLSDDDTVLRDIMFAQSDFIFSLTDAKSGMASDLKTFDDNLREGQRLLHVRNDFFSSNSGLFQGGITLGRCSATNGYAGFNEMESFISGGGMDAFVSRISGKSRALVVQSAGIDSILFCSFFLELNSSDSGFDYIYSSFYSFFIVSLYLLFDDNNMLESGLRRFFSPEQFNKNLDITYPEKFISRNSRILHYAYELAQDRRAEMFFPLPVALLETGYTRRMFSTGSLNRLMAASLALEPFFEPVDINGSAFVSGYPVVQVSSSQLFRTEVDDIYSLTAGNRERLSVDTGKYNGFFSRFLYAIEKERRIQPEYLRQTRNLILDVSENEFKFDKIVESTKKMSQTQAAKITTD